MLTPRLRNITGLLLTGVLILAAVALPGQAQGASIAFVFDCQSDNSFPSTCVPGGPYGTLTLTDSIVDPNRVDISLNLLPTFGDTLEKVYLNWAPPFLTNHKFYLVDPNAPAGVASNNPFPSLQIGSVSYSNGTQGLGNFQFDISTNYPSGTAFTLAASLALYSELPNPNAPVNIDIGDFVATSDGPGTPPLYAGYRTHNDTDNKSGEFWAGSTMTPDPVPEPTSLLLLGTGLIGVTGFAARRRAAAKKASAAASGA